MKAVTAETAAHHFEPLGRCRDVEDFEKLNRIGEGTYGTVYRARDRTTRQLVALKRVLLHNEASEGFPVTAIREIKLLKRLSHPNCVRLLDVAVGRKRSRSAGILIISGFGVVNIKAKRVMLSVLEALEYLHSQNLLHRDIKLSNVLYDRYGCVKLADFGLAREHSRFSGARTDEEADGEVLTPKVVTLWYRAPEILFGCESYSSAVDLWACGCIFGELLLQEPLMPGKNDLDQIHQICKVCQ
ncbi:hypothetical protein BBJ28_00024706 [Nothophytophthora sp. Chile5]|nr:hypothetical protein BBJ28_00024706 [Nothophytophthora sp. Chile5]